MKKHPVVLSIGVVAWNEEDSLGPTLESLFRQSVFERLCVRHEQCEILVVAHACTDRTAAVARAICERMERMHEWADAFTARVIEVPEPGEANAWNRFVHEFSAIEARFICTVAPNIAFHHRDALFNLMGSLERKPHVHAAASRACDRLIFKERMSLRDRLVVATSALAADEYETGRGLCCLRAHVARNLFVPRDLAATRDLFIREILCTDFLTRGANPGRVIVAPDAAHVCDAPTRSPDLLDERRREMMGRMVMHALVAHLHTLPAEERIHLAETLRRRESTDPDWLKRLVAAYLARPEGGRLPRGTLVAPLRRLRRIAGPRRLTAVPLACASTLLNCVASASAVRSLRNAVAPFQPGTSGAPVLGVPQLRSK